MTTCVAFSISEPFRKPLWTNMPYLISLIILFIFDTALVFLPDDNPVLNFFGVLPDADDDGNAYYSYRYKVYAIILLNCTATWVAEKLIVRYVTSVADAAVQKKKDGEFDRMMARF